MVGLLFGSPGAVLAVLALYLVLLAFASLGYRPSALGPMLPPLRLAVLVPAYDEELLVGRCVRSLLEQSWRADLVRVIVIADNCSDSTASVAERAGAEVMVRNEPQQCGKGYALRWAMDRLLGKPDPPDAVVVVDADSVADPHLLAALAGELAAGHDVVQADYTLLDEPGPARSAFVEAGFLLFHRVRFRGRARLGMPANLVGNGMVFSRRVLEEHPWSSFTGVEDLEQSISLRLAGVRPRFAPAARVSGPGAVSAAGANRQRLRWEGGRLHVVRQKLGLLVGAAIVRRDLHLLDAAIDLATPPLALLSLAIAAGAAVSGVLAFSGLLAWWSVVPWMIGLVAIPTFVVVGLWSGGARGRTWHVLLGAPLFIGWKLVNYVRLLRGHDVSRWERTDRVSS